jgi:hypothetical protein
VEKDKRGLLFFEANKSPAYKPATANADFCRKVLRVVFMKKIFYHHFFCVSICISILPVFLNHIET